MLKKQKIDREFTRLLGNQLINTKGFYDYGVSRGLTSPEGLRLTISKRQEAVKALVDKGVSKRKAARVLGVDEKTVRNDLTKGMRKKSAESAEKVRTEKEDKSVTVVETKQDVIKNGNGKDLTLGLTLDSRLSAICKEADENGGVIYAEIGGYGLRVKKITCRA